MTELVARPTVGRVFAGSRKVRLADVSPAARLRLDAAARFLQDISADDTGDTAMPDAEAWVVRKTVIEVRVFPRYLEPLTLATWCSGTGTRWAERRISLEGPRGAIEAATTWVHVDTSGRPRRIPAGFQEIYGEAAAGRSVTARLGHREPPEALARRFGWPLRFTDFDVLGHVNNAACWQVVEEALSDRPRLRAPLRAEVQHRRAIERDAVVEVLEADVADGMGLWVLADGELSVTATVVRLP